jgi:hypothetical protein
MVGTLLDRRLAVQREMVSRKGAGAKRGGITVCVVTDYLLNITSLLPCGAGGRAGVSDVIEDGPGSFSAVFTAVDQLKDFSTLPRRLCPGVN